VVTLEDRQELWKLARKIFPRDKAKQVFYFQLRVDGQTHRMADMLAARKPPGSGYGDREFMQGAWGGKNISNPLSADYYRRMAAEHGVSTDGMRYCPQLASFPGDPEAWVDSVGDVKRVAEKKGLKLEGSIEYTPTEEIPLDDGSGPYQVANDIVVDTIEDMREGNPELAREMDKNPKKAEKVIETTREILSGRE